MSEACSECPKCTCNKTALETALEKYAAALREHQRLEREARKLRLAADAAEWAARDADHRASTARIEAMKAKSKLDEELMSEPTATNAAPVPSAIADGRCASVTNR